MSKIQPLNQYILMNEIKKAKRSASGIILTTKEEKEKNQGKVTSIGKEVKDVKVGDVVIFETYKTTTFKYDNEDYMLIKEEDVLAKVAKK